MPEPSTKSPKAYQFMFVLYPESQQPAIDYIQANWPCAWALHDKDLVHIALCLEMSLVSIDMLGLINGI